MCALPVTASVVSRPKAAVSAQRLAAAYAATPSQVRESIPSVAGSGLAKHSLKRFAMAGTDTNVWPLGPQERSSG
jgi:hypothetical protein